MTYLIDVLFAVSVVFALIAACVFVYRLGYDNGRDSAYLAMSHQLDDVEQRLSGKMRNAVEQRELSAEEVEDMRAVWGDEYKGVR